MASLSDDFEATGGDAFGIAAAIFKIDNPVTRALGHPGLGYPLQRAAF
jgi:hypothetical protein